MNYKNPYQTPGTNPGNWSSGGTSIENIESKKLKKLYYRSSNIGAITFLIIIGTGALIFLLIQNNKANELYPQTVDPIIRSILLGILIYYVVTIMGLWMCSSWRRILGFVASAIMIINIPIGTIIGIAGIVALSKSPELFGKNRFRHSPLKKEFKRRKKLKIL